MTLPPLVPGSRLKFNPAEPTLKTVPFFVFAFVFAKSLIGSSIELFSLVGAVVLKLSV